MPSRFRPITARVGAETTVRREEILDPVFIQDCLESLERYGVLVFHRLGLNDEEQVAFSSKLGTVLPQGKVRADGSRDAIFKITLDENENEAAEYLKSTIHWHIDGIFDETPPVRATILTGRRLAPKGGATEFCNTYAAYEDLAPEERKRCDSLRISHSLVAANRVWNPDAGPEEIERWRNRRAPKEHPLVWRHRSGRKSLVIGMTVDHVVGMSERDGQAFVAKLSAHTTRPENVYHHDWEVGDLVIWDNCGTMHRATPYDPASGRMMHRTVLLGTESIA
ncbi:MAG TPA: TauD/TfdA family dioxygenase [Steroidobacteraceae bacterium]|nr:TauD/TfdA family dioxygenase [Steroidobacteraceae bacterium]